MCQIDLHLLKWSCRWRQMFMFLCFQVWVTPGTHWTPLDKWFDLWLQSFCKEEFSVTSLWLHELHHVHTHWGVTGCLWWGYSDLILFPEREENWFFITILAKKDTKSLTIREPKSIYKLAVQHKPNKLRKLSCGSEQSGVRQLTDLRCNTSILTATRCNLQSCPSAFTHMH